jgi:hypothetical protein
MSPKSISHVWFQVFTQDLHITTFMITYVNSLLTNRILVHHIKRVNYERTYNFISEIENGKKN